MENRFNLSYDKKCRCKSGSRRKEVSVYCPRVGALANALEYCAGKQFRSSEMKPCGFFLALEFGFVVCRYNNEKDLKRRLKVLPKMGLRS